MADHSDDLDLGQLLDSASEDFQNLNTSKPSLERSKEAVETKREPPSLPSGVQGLGMGLPDLRTMRKGKQKVSGGSHVTEALDKQFKELCFLELSPLFIYMWIRKFKRIRAFHLVMHCKILDRLRAIEERMKQEFLLDQWRRQQFVDEIIRLRAVVERQLSAQREELMVRLRADGERLHVGGERLRAEAEERMVQMRLQASIQLEQLKSINERSSSSTMD